MRKLFLAAICALSISGCATTPGGTPAGGGIGGINVEQVRNIAVTACGFLPTVTTVADIIATFTGGGAVVATASSVASAICNAVVPLRSARRGATRPAVNGVPIHGRFVR